MKHEIPIKVGGGDTATPLNLEKRLHFLEGFIVPGQTKLLDCGCGAGEYVNALSQQFQIDAWGIEYSEAKVIQAKQSNPFSQRISQGDIQNIQYSDNTFDVALLNEVLEHVPNELASLQEVHRVLKVNGVLILFSPNRWFPFETHGVYIKGSQRKIPPYTPFIPYIPVRIGQTFFDYWARNYWPQELQTIIKGAGFQISERHYLWQTFENISGSQPFLIRNTKPVLRQVANLCEKTPLVRRLGVSQVIVAKKVITHETVG